MPEATPRPAAPRRPPPYARRRPPARPQPGRTRATTPAPVRAAGPAATGDTGISGWPVLLVVLAVAAAVHANTVGNGFIDFDDPENVVDNVWIRSFGAAEVRHWFSTPLQFMYTPLTSASYAVDHAIAGVHPGWYHVTNLVLHLVNVALVWLVVRLLTARRGPAHLVAAGFAVHPVNVGGIAWIATRSSLLMSVFFLGALLLYLRYARGGRWWWLAAAVPVFALATLSKSPAVVLPVVLVLVDGYLGRRWWTGRVLAEKVPFLAIAVVIGLVGLHYRSDATIPYSYSAIDQVFLVTSSMVAYLVRFVVPYPLAFAYAYPAEPGGALPWHLYAAPLVLAALGWGLYRVARDRRAVTFGLGFFAVTLVLSQTVFLIDNFRADRYAYLPYVGLLLIVAVLAEQGAAWASGRPRAVAAAGCAVLVAVGLTWSVLTVRRNASWVDTTTILSDSIAHEPGVPFVWNSRGIAEYRAGRTDAAARDFDQALALDPDFFLADYYRGRIAYDRGDYAGAVREFDVAIGRSNVFTAAYNDRGSARMGLGDTAGAESDFGRAVELDPAFADAWANRGQARLARGDTAGACGDLRRAAGLGAASAADPLRQHCGSS